MGDVEVQMQVTTTEKKVKKVKKTSSKTTKSSGGSVEIEEQTQTIVTSSGGEIEDQQQSQQQALTAPPQDQDGAEKENAQPTTDGETYTHYIHIKLFSHLSIFQIAFQPSIRIYFPSTKHRKVNDALWRKKLSKCHIIFLY